MLFKRPNEVVCSPYRDQDLQYGRGTAASCGWLAINLDLITLTDETPYFPASASFL